MLITHGFCVRRQIVSLGPIFRSNLTYFEDPDTWDWNSTLKVTAKVELFDPVKQEWAEFHDLPRPISGSKLIEDGRGGVLMVGGDDIGNYEGHVSDIIYLSGKEGTWKRTFKTLEISSSHNIAMLIPDSYVQC